jgi:hypothetical protein
VDAQQPADGGAATDDASMADESPPSFLGDSATTDEPGGGSGVVNGICPNTPKYQNEYIQYAATGSGCIHSASECPTGYCCFPAVGLSGLCLPE